MSGLASVEHFRNQKFDFPVSVNSGFKSSEVQDLFYLSKLLSPLEVTEDDVALPEHVASWYEALMDASARLKKGETFLGYNDHIRLENDILIYQEKRHPFSKMIEFLRFLQYAKENGYGLWWFN